MVIYYKGEPDPSKSSPENVIKNANLILSFNDIKIRRHSKRFKKYLDGHLFQRQCRSPGKSGA